MLLQQTCRWRQRQHSQVSKHAQTSTSFSAPAFSKEQQSTSLPENGIEMLVLTLPQCGTSRAVAVSENKQGEYRAARALTNVTARKCEPNLDRNHAHALHRRRASDQRNQFLLLSPLYSSAQLRSRCSAPSSVPPPHCL